MRRIACLLLGIGLCGPIGGAAAGAGDEDRAWAAALSAQALPLDQVRDLDPLLDAIGARRTVLLGEATHGTREFYVWRRELTLRLVRERGFRIVVLEGDWAAVQALDGYVQLAPDAPASARAALRSLHRWPVWLWANEETLELLEALREFNRERVSSDRVGLYGMDVFGLPDALYDAPRYLERLDPAAGQQLRQDYACFRPYVGQPRGYAEAVKSGRSCQIAIAGAYERALAAIRGSPRRGSEDALQAEQNAAVVYHAERHYRGVGRSDSLYWNARAQHFHDTLARLRRYRGAGAGVVVWAHNSHVGDVRAAEAAPDKLSLGRLARESLGAAQVFIVGFGSYAGCVLASRQWGGSAAVMELPPATRGSLEHRLHDLGRPGLLLLNERLRGIPVLQAPLPHRSVGVIYRPEQEYGYGASRWLERYDALLYVDRSEALRAIDDRQD